ncbi:kinase-like domain-containing protein [Mycena galericulata]|nr:kinase-like domain-containing protein [Mycena galericulata]
MQYIANNTTVPVPKVHRVYKYNNVTVIEMEFVPGKEAYVLSGMSQTAQRALLDELESYVKQIRNLAPPTPGLLASAYVNSSRDHRFGTPFSDHEGFHRFLRKGGDLECWDADKYRVVIQSHTQRYISKFTHGDLAPRNVLVHKGRISAIIDWDCAGWRPEYWEVTKAQFSYVGMGPQEWLDALTRASGGTYDLQLRAERTLWSAAEFPSTPVQTWSSPGVKDDDEGDDELQLSAT